MNQVRRSLSPPHPVRLNPIEARLLREITQSLTPDQLADLITSDRGCRDGWRNHSGRPPKPVALILRRALMHGLPIVAKELSTETE